MSKGPASGGGAAPVPGKGWLAGISGAGPPGHARRAGKSVNAGGQRMGLCDRLWDRSASEGAWCILWT